MGKPFRRRRQQGFDILAFGRRHHLLGDFSIAQDDTVIAWKAHPIKIGTDEESVDAEFGAQINGKVQVLSLDRNAGSEGGASGMRSFGIAAMAQTLVFEPVYRVAFERLLSVPQSIDAIMAGDHLLASRDNLRLRACPACQPTRRENHRDGD